MGKGAFTTPAHALLSVLGAVFAGAVVLAASVFPLVLVFLLVLCVSGGALALVMGLAHRLARPARRIDGGRHR